VQIEPGPIFRDCCVMKNEATEGTIEFTAQRYPGKDPFSGNGELAYITLEVQEPQPGIYTIFFDRNESRLLDGEGHSIPIGEFTDAVIIVPSRTIAGQVTREGWSNYARSGVNVILIPAVPPHDPLAWGHACTDTAGDFQVETWNDLPTTGDILPPDDPPTSPTCTSLWAYVRLNFTNYLSECFWQCADGEVVHLGRRNLEGGDVIADGCINILDITKIISEFGHRVDPPCYVPFSECPPDPPLPNEAPSGDINGDCAVNILDLSMAAENFGLWSSCR
jgi:hypothetical protein